MLGRTVAYMEKSSFVKFCRNGEADQAKSHFIVHHPLAFFSSSSSFPLLQNVSQIFGQITTASGHTATVSSVRLQTLSDQVSEIGQVSPESAYPAYLILNM